MADTFHKKRFIKIKIRNQIHLIEQNHIRFFKGERIFIRLIASVRHRNDKHFYVFTDGKFRRTYKIPYILNKKYAAFVHLHIMDGIVHERRIKMAGAEGIDLRCGNPLFF